MKYEASIELNHQLQKVEFETDGSPVQYLWDRYGMSCYIEYVKEIPAEEE